MVVTVSSMIGWKIRKTAYKCIISCRCVMVFFLTKQKVISYFKTLWIQVPPKNILYPPSCTLSAFLAATWIHREITSGVCFRFQAAFLVDWRGVWAGRGGSLNAGFWTISGSKMYWHANLGPRRMGFVMVELCELMARNPCVLGFTMVTTTKYHHFLYFWVSKLKAQKVSPRWFIVMVYICLHVFRIHYYYLSAIEN